ncbi:MAG TPA: trypsin-like peptidase domain-containing protein [Jatrophihabitans sp.]|nr:trypsin-like peptidase domain-containing protein [Jatrophihabitans sp.]
MSEPYRWIERTSDSGVRYRYVEWADRVPHVSRGLAHSVVYIYDSPADAETGGETGGTGVLISYPVKGRSDRVHVYVATNSHVVRQDLYEPVGIRINQGSGTATVLRIPRASWIHHPDRDDIAVAALDFDTKRIPYGAVPISCFVTREQFADDTFGDGDECLYIGRHWGLDGKQRNTPAARSGIIAIADPEPINQEQRAHRQESVAVEARSLGGYSGAPVFVYRSDPLVPPKLAPSPEFGFKTLIGKFDVVVASAIERPFAFLGVTWGHMNGKSAVTGPGSYMSEWEKRIALNSGIMLVVPAWKIRELLEDERLVNLREQDEAELRERDDAERPRAVLDGMADEAARAPDDRVSLDGVQPEDALRALLKTPPHANPKGSE